MKNYLFINGKKIYLTDEQVRELMEDNTKLADITAGETFKIGDREFIVLEHLEAGTAVITKDIIRKMAFGSENNDFRESNVKDCLAEFGDEMAKIVGSENLVEHTVDLTSDDGLKDYGAISAYISMLTAEMYRRYVHILDAHKIGRWWWLATPHSTSTHENSNWVKCVSPHGVISYDIYISDDSGVRPFCILKSDIFVSKT